MHIFTSVAPSIWPYRKSEYYCSGRYTTPFCTRPAGLTMTDWLRGWGQTTWTTNGPWSSVLGVGCVAGNTTLENAVFVEETTASTYYIPGHQETLTQIHTHHCTLYYSAYTHNPDIGIMTFFPNQNATKEGINVNRLQKEQNRNCGADWSTCQTSKAAQMQL